MSLDTADRDLTHLYPPFAELLQKTIAQVTAETAGKYPLIAGWTMAEGFRSQSRQNYLYAQGRTRPGAIVTKTLKSKHTSGCAGDVYPHDAAGNILWDAPGEAFQQLGHAARTQGLEWGGDFPKLTGGTFVDPPHVQASGKQRQSWGSKPAAYLKSKGLI